MSSYYVYKDLVITEYLGSVVLNKQTVKEVLTQLQQKTNEVTMIEVGQYEYEHDDQIDFYNNKDFRIEACESISLEHGGLYITTHRCFELLNMMNKIPNFQLAGVNPFNDYSWIDKCDKICAFGMCSPEMFNSGKLDNAFIGYKQWMDVDLYPDMEYMIEDPSVHINRNIKNVIYSTDDDHELIMFLEQLKECNQLDSVKIYSSTNNRVVLDYMLDIECKRLTFAIVGLLDDLIRLDKFSVINSSYPCTREAVESTTRLVDGSLRDQCHGGFKDIFDRNKVKSFV